MTLRRKQFAHPELDTKTVKLGIHGGEDVVIKPVRPTVVIEEIGRWKNADQIHNWFVRNVMFGKNEPGEVVVTRQQLCKLLEDVREVVKRSHLIPKRTFFGRKLGRGTTEGDQSGNQVIVDTSSARKLLPVSGRFFGSGYDEQYMYELHETISILLEALEGHPDAYYSYQASW